MTANAFIASQTESECGKSNGGNGVNIHTSQYHLDRVHRKHHQLECFLCECRTTNHQISFHCGKTLRSSRCM